MLHRGELGDDAGEEVGAEGGDGVGLKLEGAGGGVLSECCGAAAEGVGGRKGMLVAQRHGGDDDGGLEGRCRGA